MSELGWILVYVLSVMMLVAGVLGFVWVGVWEVVETWERWKRLEERGRGKGRSNDTR